MEQLLAHLQTFLLLVLIRLVGTFAFVRLFVPFQPIAQALLLQSALAFALALPFVPDIIVALPDTPDLSAAEFVARGVVALLAGASFAVLCSVPIKIAAAVGEVIDNARGLSANGPLNPVTRDEATPLSSAVSTVLSLLVFTFGWHLDILDDFYAVSPMLDMHAIGVSLSGGASLWLHSVDVLGMLLTRALPLLGLLLAVDVAVAVATKHLKSGDMGGAENTIKTLVVAAWLVLLLQDVLSPHGLITLRAAFSSTVSPLLRLF